jgi:hypothetical protein
MGAIRIVRFVLCASIAAVMFGGCSSTNFTDLWMDEQAASPAIDNLLVVALDRNPEMRRFWEDALAAEFQAQGLLARPSYQLFPADLPDSQQVAVVLQRDNHDAAIVTSRLDVITSAPPEGGYRDSPPGAHDDYWRRGYTVAYTHANQPVGEKKAKEARFRVDLARADGRLVWTGTSTPIDPTKAEKLRTEIAGQIVPELERRKLIPKN